MSSDCFKLPASPTASSAAGRLLFLTELFEYILKQAGYSAVGS